MTDIKAYQERVLFYLPTASWYWPRPASQPDPKLPGWACGPKGER